MAFVKLSFFHQNQFTNFRNLEIFILFFASPPHSDRSEVFIQKLAQKLQYRQHRQILLLNRTNYND
jgi:hypothetical protein